MESCQGCPQLPEIVPSALETFAAMSWGLEGDLWTFAKLPEVFGYLRSGKNLAIPNDWRPLIPNSLPHPAPLLQVPDL